MLTKEQLHTLRAFAKDTGPFRCTKGQATELAEALTEALSLLEIAEVRLHEDLGVEALQHVARASGGDLPKTLATAAESMHGEEDY